MRRFLGLGARSGARPRRCRSRARPGHDRHDRGTRARPAGARPARRHRHRQERRHRLPALRSVGRHRRLPLPGPSRRHLRRERRADRLRRPVQEERGQRAVHDLRRVPPQRRHHDGGAHRHRGVVAHRREVLGRGRGRDRHPDREPAAQRPAVREPGRARSRREPGPPHRPHQVHPVRAAGGRGRRPQHQLPDRRRRQQRRHRRRPRAELPARLHRRVQLRDPALPRRRGPRAGRGHQRGHQERNQRPPRVRVRLFPRRRPQLEDGDGEAQQRTEGWLPTLPVRREPGGARGQGPDPLLRVLRAGQPGQHAVGEHSRALSGEGRRVRAALPREHVRGQGHPPGEPRQFPVRALRLQRQQPALRNDPELPARVVGHEQEQVPLRQHELQLRARRRKAERVHLPVLVLPQPHRRELDAAHRDLPERRERRAGGEHAADHRPAQIPVP